MTQAPKIADLPPRPLTLLIAALGGDGGGQLADWIVAAAMSCDYPVQSSSIPGVAQRTGATSYYLEIFAVAQRLLDGKVPVMALTPTPGAVDVVVASELMEAGRALSNAAIGVSTSTIVIASTHRVFAVSEKVTPGDGRADSEKVLAAIREHASKAVVFDMAATARQQGCMVNAVLFGALAGSGALPLPRSACELAIREAGKGVEASLQGFQIGFERASKEGICDAAPTSVPQARTPVERVRKRFPAECHSILEAGVERLTDYQDVAYADLYIDRLESVFAVDREAGGSVHQYRLTCEAGRQLALWMSFEDLIRVAELKTRKNRLERVRTDAGIKPGELLILTEYLKPGLDEVCSILSPKWAERLRNWATKNNKQALFSKSLRLKTSSISGFIAFKALTWLKPWRRHTSRFKSEQLMIDRWLGAVKRLGFAVQDVELALEIVECARVVRGYGETHQKGVDQFVKIFDSVIESGRETNPKKLGDAIKRARIQAMGNPDAPKVSVISNSTDPGKPIFWMPRSTKGKSEVANIGSPSSGCQ